MCIMIKTKILFFSLLRNSLASQIIRMYHRAKLFINPSCPFDSYKGLRTGSRYERYYSKYERLENDLWCQLIHHHYELLENKGSTRLRNFTKSKSRERVRALVVTRSW